jgi:hypothetical protein
MVTLPTYKNIREGKKKVDEALYDMIVTVAGTSTGSGDKVVAVSVAAAATSGSSSADADLVGGTITGFQPVAVDQILKGLVLNADGSVTATLNAAATAINQFNVVVQKK